MSFSFYKILEKIPSREKGFLKAAVGNLPCFVREGPAYRRWRRFLRNTENWSRSRIEEWQLGMVREIVRHAMEKTAGYRNLFAQAGITLDDIRTLQDVKRLPFTTKETFRDRLEEFSVPRLFREYVTTGGSTGIPFGFYNTLKNSAVESAFMQDAWSKVGWRAGDCNAILRGGFVGTVDCPWRFDSFSRELHLSSYVLTRETLVKYLESWEHFRPRFLQAYPSSLMILCDLLRDNSGNERYTFDLILLGSENIYPWQMEKFREVFPNSRFFGWYGHAEKAVFAPWCDRSEIYHIHPFYGYTEIVDEQGNEVESGREGEIVGTSFHNRLTPFIRYRTLDRARKGETGCPGCGRSLDTIERIEGRIHEFIVTKTGRHISMTAINMHDNIFDGLLQFQFFQDDPKCITFRYLPKKDLSDNEIDSIRKGLVLKLGDDIELVMEKANEIPRTASGKYRFLDQKLPIRYGDR